MAASDYVPTFFKKPLALGGASTDENILGTRVKPLGLVGFDFGPTKSDIDGMKAPRAGPKWSTRLLTRSAGRPWVRNRSRTPAADAGLTGWAVPGTCPERAP